MNFRIHLLFSIAIIAINADVDVDDLKFTNLRSVGAINPVLWRSLSGVQQMWLRTSARHSLKIQRTAKVQDPFADNFTFPCDLSLGRSKEVPESVHKLRPGDIQAIGAIGDSLTTASGALSSRLGHMFTENRGLAWSIGGQWDWRNATTVPNILKVFNPNLVGYSLNDSLTYSAGTEFNTAEIGAISLDLPDLAKVLVERFKKDPRVNFENDWKLVTISIGANDICSGVCTLKDPNKMPKIHKKYLLKALRYLKENLPRVLVNVVSKPKVEAPMFFPNKDPMCQTLHLVECSCFIGGFFNATKKTRAWFSKIEEEYMKAEEDVTKMEEFRNLTSFAVIYQPFGVNSSVSTRFLGLRQFY